MKWAMRASWQTKEIRHDADLHDLQTPLITLIFAICPVRIGQRIALVEGEERQPIYPSCGGNSPSQSDWNLSVRFHDEVAGVSLV